MKSELYQNFGRDNEDKTVRLIQYVCIPTKAFEDGFLKGLLNKLSGHKAKGPPIV